MDIAAASTEYVHVPVTATGGGTINTTVPPRFAFLPGGSDPATTDWYTGQWADGAARILVGPNGGTLSLPTGHYWLWVTWAAGLESPVYRAGRVRVY